MLRQYGREYGASRPRAVVMDHDGAVRAMVGGRDYGAEPVQPRDRRAAPARLLVQALCLCRRADRTASSRPRSWSTPRSASATGARRIIRARYSGSMTLTRRWSRSINTIPVKLSITIGNGNPQAGRAKIVRPRAEMGMRTPLLDTPSLPIGADEVTVLDHTGGFATFPNGGKAVTPHAILEVRSGTGDLIWRFDRDGKKPCR